MPFSNELSVGNRIIDSEHKNLHTIIMVIERSIDSENLEVLLEAFDLFEKDLCAYFVVEENIARALNFDFNQHKLAHREILNKFKRIKDELMAKNSIGSILKEDDLIFILKECLIQHINVDGSLFKAVLSTQLYDFKPGDPVLDGRCSH